MMDFIVMHLVDAVIVLGLGMVAGMIVGAVHIYRERAAFGPKP